MSVLQAYLRVYVGAASLISVYVSAASLITRVAALT